MHASATEAQNVSCSAQGYVYLGGFSNSISVANIRSGEEIRSRAGIHQIQNGGEDNMLAEAAPNSAFVVSGNCGVDSVVNVLDPISLALTQSLKGHTAGIFVSECPPIP